MNNAFMNKGKGKFMRLVIVCITALLAASTGALQAADRFEKLAIFLEQNVQDGDAEVKFDVIGTPAGLSALQVVAPDGRVVVDFKAPASKLGLQHLTLESPEPKNDGRLQADFPEGVYKFTGTTTTGETLRGEAALAHAFPAAVAILRPRADEEKTPVTGLRVTWKPAKDAQTITVLVEDEKSGGMISAALPGAATGFAVPDGFLTGGTAYKLAVGVIARSGNKTVTEISFTTAGKK